MDHFLKCLAGVLKEWFVQPMLDNGFYSGLKKEIDDEWKHKHGKNVKNVSETIKEYLVTFLGEPINKLLR